MAFFTKSDSSKRPNFSLSGGMIEEIEASKILPNPAQPRREFDTEALLSLSESIRCHGILQPPVVRRLPNGDTYELIAGERRLRAARMAGLSTLPCIVRDGDAGESAELAIIENLQRRDLTMFEEAAALASLCEKFRLTQEQIGERLSVSQSYIANKLRLLRLTEEERDLIQKNGLTERHARAVLRLPPELRAPALRHIIATAMNVSATEKYIEGLLDSKKPRTRQSAGVIKDIRLFYNSVDRAMSLVREAGIDILAERKENETEIEMLIRIQKPQKGQSRAQKDDRAG